MTANYRQQIDWITEQRIEDMVRLYRDGKSLRQVAKAVQLSHVRVRTILLEQGVTLRPPIRFPNGADMAASSRALVAAISVHLGGDPRDAEIERLRSALREVRRDIVDQPHGVITCTVWHLASPAETTVDFIDATLAEPRS